MRIRIIGGTQFMGREGVADGERPLARWSGGPRDSLRRLRQLTTDN
jgi:hypothetical protein